MKSSFFNMFAMVFTFYVFYVFTFLRFYTSLQGIAFAVKAPPATGFYSCSGGCCKIWDSTIADQYSNT